jgi:ankyrin repeat protein
MNKNRNQREWTFVAKMVNILSDHRVKGYFSFIHNEPYDQYTQNISCWQVLLDCGADPSLQNDRGETALHEALERDAPGSFDAVTLLASAGTDLSRCTAYRETPLHLAARKNRPSTVAMLLKNAAPPNAQDLRGNTALHLAAGKGYHEVVSLLLARPNIELNAPNKEGLTPLHIAVESGFIKVVRVST